MHIGFWVVYISRLLYIRCTYYVSLKSYFKDTHKRTHTHAHACTHAHTHTHTYTHTHTNHISLRKYELNVPKNAITHLKMLNRVSTHGNGQLFSNYLTKNVSCVFAKSLKIASSCSLETSQHSGLASTEPLPSATHSH